MEAYVIMLQGRDGDRTFYAPALTPPWTTNLQAAGQYVRRHEAEQDAAKAAARVLRWCDAWDVAGT